MTARYSLDTSAILGMFRRRFPPDVVPSFWPKLDGLVREGVGVCIDEVHAELRAQAGDEPETWLAARPGMIRALTPEILRAARGLINAFPVTKPGSTARNHADPFVVALAQVEGLAVVSDEQSDPSSRLIKIPDLCAKIGVVHHSVFDLARVEGWRF